MLLALSCNCSVNEKTSNHRHLHKEKLEKYIPTSNRTYAITVIVRPNQTHKLTANSFTGKAEVLSPRGLKSNTLGLANRSHHSPHLAPPPVSPPGNSTRDRIVIVSSSLRRIIVVEGWLRVLSLRFEQQIAVSFKWHCRAIRPQTVWKPQPSVNYEYKSQRRLAKTKRKTTSKYLITYCLRDTYT